MTRNDLVTLIGNFSRSLPAVQHLITGAAYILGLVFIMSGLGKLREMIEGGQHSRTKLVVPMAYFLAGALMLYLPSSLQTFSATLFGDNSALSYSNYNPYDIYSSMYVLIQTAGLIWFVRGCVLLAHASSSSQGQEGSKGTGPKGLTFVFAGIMAMNFSATIGTVEYIVHKIMTLITPSGVV